MISKAGPLILDREGKIVPESNIMLGYQHLLIDHIHNFLLLTNTTPLDRATEAFKGHSLAIQSWFVTYGHFHDEVYALADFKRKHDKDSAIVLDYPPSDNMHLNYQTSTNYERLQSLALGHAACNIFEAGPVPVRLNGCSLISHMLDAPTFHLFPEEIRNTLISQTASYQPNNPDVIFISRQMANHLPRNITNQNEIEDNCRAMGIPVHYPEQLSFDRFVRRLNASRAIIITWGGALTNLVYLAKGARVLILKSKSYRHEDLRIFNKIIQQRLLKVEVIVADEENIISIGEFTDKAGLLAQR
jgi:capsular polysaccharide biosynthesis protein